MRFNRRLIFFTSQGGKKIVEQQQPLREAPYAHPDVMDFLRPRNLRRAVDLERQPGEQMIHLVQCVIAYARRCTHAFTLFTLIDI